MDAGHWILGTALVVAAAIMFLALYLLDEEQTAHQVTRAQHQRCHVAHAATAVALDAAVRSEAVARGMACQAERRLAATERLLEDERGVSSFVAQVEAWGHEGGGPQ